MQVLTVNVGSSSVKLRVVGDDGSVSASADQLGAAERPVAESLAAFLQGAPAIDAAGHRVVHGGDAFGAATLLHADAEATLDRLADLAPLHNPRSLEAMRALGRLRPSLPQVACFDTAFHATLPAAAATYALPAEWRERWPLRRYGFHGLSHSYASRRAAELVDRPGADLRLVTAHIGAGASLAAVDGGRSVDTTMGFTPLEGVVMATRSGSVDPGLVLWLQRHGGLSAEAVERGLDERAGLLGLSGRSGDLRLVLAAADAGDGPARLAYAVYLHRLRAAVAAMAAAMGGVDGLVFTGGAGEGSARLRRDVCTGLEFLGLILAGGPDDGPAADRLVPTAGPAVVAVVTAREDLEIARQVRELLAGGNQ